MRKARLGFLGAGRMAEAIARAALDASLYTAASMRASDISAERRELFERDLGIRTSADNATVAAECSVLLVAVKPQDLSTVLQEIRPHLTSDRLLITICAGVPTSRFESAAPGKVRVVRAMPNMPIQVRRGATGICAGRHATCDDLDLAEELFSAAGIVVSVEERLMDAVTALSGSGPAYFYALAEALIEAGRAQGLTEETARALTIQTARGAAEMMATSNRSPQELRQFVTSKGGTTEAALRRMEDGHFRQLMIEAVEAAVRRARELAGG